MKQINPDIRITKEAVKALAEWALEQAPPLAIIGACDRALWWTRRAGDKREFHDLDADESFTIPDEPLLGILKKLPREEQEIAPFPCPHGNCPDMETRLNAVANGNMYAHVCPDVIVKGA